MHTASLSMISKQFATSIGLPQIDKDRLASLITPLSHTPYFVRYRRRIISKRIQLISAAFVLLNLAWIVALAVPMAVLVATLAAFGRLSAENEITALKAAGTSLWQLMIPFFVIALILCYLLIEFNNRVLPGPFCAGKPARSPPRF